MAACAALSSALASCGGGSVLPPPKPRLPFGVVDAASGPCTVSYDGLIWYDVPAGSFSPIDMRDQRCSATLAVVTAPPIPSWARPSGTTKAILVATSLQETYSLAGMQTIEAAAAPAHTPITWMIGNALYFSNSALYDQYHQSNGDDVQVEDDPALLSDAQTAFPWYRPSVSVEGAGHERNIAQALSFGETGFWGIAWDSAYVDSTNDVGAPWGTYCADVHSYKRPSPDGSCAMLAFEWTARDLTRTFLTGHPEYYSTDPDDLQQRAGFDPSAAQAYVRAVVDAYAAAGESAPLVMVSQQESAEDTNPGDPSILAALYGEAARDGMRAETLSQANADARAFSALPRAVAFPYIAGGANLPSPFLPNAAPLPATIDFHDNEAGMTFLAGHTLPTTVYEYADDQQSVYDVGFPPLAPAQTPTLSGVDAANGLLMFTFEAPAAVHYGVALWTDPANLGLSGSGITPAGHAGVVVTFDLQPGTNQIVVHCAACTSTTFEYST